jgi:hypothetical protein
MNSARQKIPGFEKQGRSMKVHLGRFPKTGECKVSIRIDRWDTYDMDQTLAMLIVPMLKQLKESKQGAPNTDSADVPKRLRATKRLTHDGLDKHHFARWDWILDEMIWTFEAILEGDHQFFDHSAVDDSADLMERVKQVKMDRRGLRKHEERIQNGLRLFGRYYLSLWG